MTAINNLPGLAKFNNATHVTDGLMSRNDKQKLDSLDKAVTIHTILYASNWSKNRPYTQTIELPDITADTNGTLTIDPSATEEEIQACIDADIIISEQSFNYMTLQVTDVKPEIDIPVIIVHGRNLAVITPPAIVDTGNHVHDVIVQPNDWVEYLDTYKTAKATLYIPGINESVVGSISMKSGINEDEAFAAAKARIEIFNVMDNTVELILRGEKPSIPLHLTVYYGPSIAIVRRPVFGGKITPHARYQEFDDSKTGLGVTKTQSAIEEMVTGTTGINNKPTHFKTIAVMQEAMELQVGQLVTTSGYYTENDGGGATYLITSNYYKTEGSNSVNVGGSVHKLKNGLIAEIVLESGEDINLKCFGLRADGITNDIPAFERGFNFCKQIRGGTIKWQGIAAINEPLVVDSHYINIRGYGYGSVIKANFKEQHILSVSYEEHSTTESIKQIYIGNFAVDGNDSATKPGAKHGIIIDDNLPIYNCIFENILIHDTSDYGFIVDNCKNCQFNLITVDTCHGGIKIMDDAYNLKFDSCKVINNNSNETLLIAGETAKPSTIEFNSCYFGDSQSTVLMTIDNSFNVDFNRCTLDLKRTLCDDYAIKINEHALYTRFIDCFFNGFNYTCGMFNSAGPETSIINMKAIDIKSQIHISVTDDIHINGLLLLGDSTSLRIETPNDDKSIIDMGTTINTVNDDNILFESNANYYNFYMNQSDKIGVKGKLDNYVLDKHLEDDVFEDVFTTNSDKLNKTIKFPNPGVWEVDMYLTLGEGNQGCIYKYQFAFKQNSLYHIANTQQLITPIKWGNDISLTHELTHEGKLTLNFTNSAKTNTYWEVKFKARRIMNFDI